MRLEAQARFWTDIAGISSKSIKTEALHFVDDVAHLSFSQLYNSYSFKQMKTHAAHYSLRIGDYRLGCRYDRGRDTLVLMRILPREIVYDHFP